MGRRFLPYMISLVGLIPEASTAAGLRYRVELLHDTLNIYEPVWVTCHAANLTDTAIPIIGLSLVAPWHDFEIFDERGDDIVMLRAMGARGSGPDYILGPGESMEVSDILNHGSRYLDSGGVGGYFPAGTYRAVFRWSHVPREFLQPGADHLLVDSVTFVVVNPSPEDAPAMDCYRRARRERVDQYPILVECFQTYPDSRIAPEFLLHLWPMTRPGFDSLGFDRDTIATLFIRTFPNHPIAPAMITRNTQSWDGATAGAFGEVQLELVRRLVPPDSRAGRYCKVVEKRLRR